MQQQFERYTSLIENGLERYLPHTQIPQLKLLDAITYSIFDSPVRIHPVLTLAFCEAAGGRAETALPFACAVEMINTHSLIRDALPCMDGDGRPGDRPPNHKVFGEATAVLAGDALLSAAFETILDTDYTGDTPPAAVIKAAHRLAWASGLYGMAGGCQLNQDATALDPSIDTAAQIYLLKAVTLFEAAAVSGCELAGATREQLTAASSYARSLGMAFQIGEDLLDLEDGADKASGQAGAGDGKLTFVALLGAEECHGLVGKLTESAVEYLEPFEDKDFLVWLARIQAGTPPSP